MWHHCISQHSLNLPTCTLCEIGSCHIYHANRRPEVATTLTRAIAAGRILNCFKIKYGFVLVGWSDQMTKLLIADPATQHDVIRYRAGIKCTKTKADLTFLSQCNQNLNNVVFVRGGLSQQDAAPTPAYSIQKPSAFFGLLMQGGGGTCAGFIQNFFREWMRVMQESHPLS